MCRAMWRVCGQRRACLKPKLLHGPHAHSAPASPIAAPYTHVLFTENGRHATQPGDTLARACCFVAHANQHAPCDTHTTHTTEHGGKQGERWPRRAESAGGQGCFMNQARGFCRQLFLAHQTKPYQTHLAAAQARPSRTATNFLMAMNLRTRAAPLHRAN